MKNNIDYYTFITDTLALARTIVVKIEDIAKVDNRLLELYGYEVSDDKRTWRYYLNLNGQYHENDDPMYITSLDDDSLILFSKDNLEIHQTTKKAYRQGGYYFTRLIDLYPHQEELIKGILNPIDLDKAINADNYSILSYNKDYVLWNETQLIYELQEFINNFTFQCFNTEYKYTDNLMLPILLSQLHSNIFTFLISNRYENRKTRNAHSFFIWSHLQSLGLSIAYKNVLNNKQTMYFFRNLEYILRNAGKEKTFHELIDIVLTERSIPLSSYDMELNTTEMIDKLSPEPLYISSNLNMRDQIGIGRTAHPISIVTKKEIPDTIDNEYYYNLEYKDAYFTSQFGVSNSYAIKVLESELKDTTNQHQDTFYSILTNHWLYLADNDIYRNKLSIPNIKEGGYIKIDTRQAFVLWIHLLNLSKGNYCENIPEFFYTRVNKITPPSLETLMSLGHQDVLNKEWCLDLLNTHISYSRIISPEAFYLKCLDIYLNLWNHKKMYAAYQDISYLSRRKNAVESLYESGYALNVNSHKTYSDFLTSIELDLSEYTEVEALEQAFEVWKVAVGWDSFPYVTLAQEQNSLISLMKFLSSYTVQYINNVIEDEGTYEADGGLYTGNGNLLGAENGSELHSINETNRIPVHHRVVTDNESSMLHLGSIEEKGYELYTESIKENNIDGSLNLYGKLFSDNEIYNNYMVHVPMRLVEVEASLSDEELIDALIPTDSVNYLEPWKTNIITFNGKNRSGKFEALELKLPKDFYYSYKDYGAYSYFYNTIDNTISSDGNRYTLFFAPDVNKTDHVLPLLLSIKNTETNEVFDITFNYVYTSSAVPTAKFIIEKGQRFPVGGKRAKVYYNISGMGLEEVYAQTAMVTSKYPVSPPFTTNDPIRVSGTQVLPGEFEFRKSFWLEEVRETIDKDWILEIYFTSYFNIGSNSYHIKTYGEMAITPDMIYDGS